jgi:hypothetical protein
MSGGEAMKQTRKSTKSSGRKRGLKKGIIDLLDSIQRPMHYRDITAALKKRGYTIQGQTPDLTVNSILSRGREFERTGKGTYQRNSVVST